MFVVLICLEVVRWFLSPQSVVAATSSSAGWNLERPLNHVLSSPLRPGDAPLEYALPIGHVLTARIDTSKSMNGGREVSYEMRIGWPATGPGKFQIWVDSQRDVAHMGQASALSERALMDIIDVERKFDKDGGKDKYLNTAEAGSQLRRRRLLNADKVVFHGNGKQEDRREIWGHVLVEKEGVSWNPKIENMPVRFNVLVEELLFLGVLPARVGRLVLFLVVVITAGLLIGLPMLRQQLRGDKTTRAR